MAFSLLSASSSRHTHLSSLQFFPFKDCPRNSVRSYPALPTRSKHGSHLRSRQFRSKPFYSEKEECRMASTAQELSERPSHRTFEYFAESKVRKLEVMDTTLRDGEQTDGVSFTAAEKIHVAHFLLQEVGVDRVEIASARVSQSEQKLAEDVISSVRRFGLEDRVEILGFTDHKLSVDWIAKAGGKVLNLLTKGSRRHCELQLQKTLSEHLADIERTVSYALENKLSVNVYLEDWSNGFMNSPDYVREMIQELKKLPIQRFFLPDTLGVMSPEEVTEGIEDILTRHPSLKLEFHGHNDYGLAVANALAAARAGASGIHVTVNGLGERAGNTPLETVVTALHDKLPGIRTGVDERLLVRTSQLIELFSGKKIQGNHPVVGKDVCTHTAGVHADGDRKHNLYTNPLLPERFGRYRIFGLGKLCGKASVASNLQSLGLELPPERQKVLLDKIKELGAEKKSVTAEDLPYLIKDLFGEGPSDLVSLTDVRVTSDLYGESVAEIEILWRGKTYRTEAKGVGGFAAFIHALTSFTECLGLELPRPVQYDVRVLYTEQFGADAAVEISITWQPAARLPSLDATKFPSSNTVVLGEDGKPRRVSSYDNPDYTGTLPHVAVAARGDRFCTMGTSTDQLMAAVRATEKMINQMILHGALDFDGQVESCLMSTEPSSSPAPS